MNHDINADLLDVVQDGNIQEVEHLLNAGANINATNKFLLTPLMLAARDGFSTIVDLLLARGADVTAREELGYTAADIAEMNHHPEIAEKLKSVGAIRN